MLEDSLDHFHQHHEIFRTSGVHLNSFNLPHSHSAVYYVHLIWAYGTPNGLCSFITELKHFKVVKEPWCWSSCWEALRQMLTTNSHLNKLAAAHMDFTSCGMLDGTALEDVLCQFSESHSALHSVSNSDGPRSDFRYPIIWQWPTSHTSFTDINLENDDNGVNDSCIIESDVKLSKTPCRCSSYLHISVLHWSQIVKYVYPDQVDEPNLMQLI